MRAWLLVARDVCTFALGGYWGVRAGQDGLDSTARGLLIAGSLTCVGLPVAWWLGRGDG